MEWVEAMRVGRWEMGWDARGGGIIKPELRRKEGRQMEMGHIYTYHTTLKRIQTPQIRHISFKTSFISENTVYNLRKNTVDGNLLGTRVGRGGEVESRGAS